jgi:putative IMPACT (imprinted ancient) family translation regulator
VKLGAGGLVRAYTDAVAQALQAAPKVPLQRQKQLCFSVPFALEGLARREIDAAGATLGEVLHGSVVQLHITLPEPSAAAFVARLNDVGQGRVGWVE